MLRKRLTNLRVYGRLFSSRGKPISGDGSDSEILVAKRIVNVCDERTSLIKACERGSLVGTRKPYR